VRGKKMELETERIFNLKVPMNGISEECKAEIDRYLICETGHTILDPKFDWVWLNRRGTFPKRAAAWFKRVLKIDLTGEQMSKLGNIAKAHSDLNEDFWIDFTKRLSWERGEFGDGSSCFWTANREARYALEADGAYAVRFFLPNPFGSWGGQDDGETYIGIARCWLVERYRNGQKFLIIFNAYARENELDLLKIARILSFHFGCSYKKIELTNYGETTGMVYINAGGLGYAIGATEVIKGLSRFDLEIGNAPETCKSCDIVVWGEDAIWAPNGDGPYCKDCYRERYAICDGCGRDVAIEDVTRGGNCKYCKDCADSMEQCPNCSEVFFPENGTRMFVGVTDDGRAKEEVWCGVCERGYFCRSCNKRWRRAEMICNHETAYRMECPICYARRNVGDELEVAA